MDQKIVYRPDLAEDATEFCPLCGAPVAPVEEPAPEPAAPAQPETTPRTVEELMALCASHDVPPVSQRFFIGMVPPVPSNATSNMLTPYIIVSLFQQAFLCGAADQCLCVGKILLRCVAFHIHLRDADLHGKVSLSV